MSDNALGVVCPTCNAGKGKWCNKGGWLNRNNPVRGLLHASRKAAV